MSHVRPLCRIWIVVPAFLAACTTGSSERGSGAVEATLSPRLADECLRDARVCAYDRIAQARVADPSASMPEASVLLGSCLEAGKVENYDEDGQEVSCKDACAGDDADEVCDHIIETITELGPRPTACIAAFQDCMSGCRSEGDNMTDGMVWEAESVTGLPESWCTWAGSERGTCSSFAAELQVCGGTLASPREDHAACMKECEATAVIWVEDSDEELCADPEGDMCQYCEGQCEDVSTTPATDFEWQTVLTLTGQHVAQGQTQRHVVTVPAGVARLRVLLTPGGADQDPDLVVRAPNATSAACTSQGGAGAVETCAVSPLEGHDALTAGDWVIEVVGYENDDNAPTYDYSIEGSLGRAPETAAE